MSESTENEKSEIINQIHKLNSAISNKDLQAQLNVWQKDNNTFLFGSAKHEAFAGRENLELGIANMINQMNLLEEPITLLDRKFVIENLQIQGNIAWYAKKISFKVGSNKDTQLYHMRATGVLAKNNGEWKYVQRHVSSPQAGISEGSTWPTAEGLENEIDKWITSFNLNPRISDELKKSELLNYLTKAQEIIKISK